MRRLFLLACLMSWVNPAYAQIDCPASFESGQLMTAAAGEQKIDGLTEERIWTASDGVQLIPVDNGKRVFFAAPGGEHTLFLQVKLTYEHADPPEAEGKPTTRKVEFLPYDYKHPFVVKGGPGPAPVESLRDKAGDAAGAIGVAVKAISDAVKANKLPPELFLEVLRGYLSDWQGNKAIPVIESRVAKLTDAKAIAAELDKIVAELGTTPAPDDPVDPSQPLAVTYVYEVRDTPVPVGVTTGINRLNRERNIRATAIDDDILDGDGDVPDQYKVPITEAHKVGLPALVVTSGDKALKVVKDPRTEQQVFEAIAP